MLPRKAPKIASSAAAGAPPVEGRDRITNLPDGVLQHILSFLPAQDVVRTCVLARRWRRTWESTTVLRFVCGGTNEPKSMKEIQDFVEQLLRLRIRGGTPLDTCEFRLAESTDENDMSHIDLWIRIALQCKVRVLQFSYVGDDNYQNSNPQYGHPYFISQYLKKLELENLEEMVPRFLDFSCCPFLEDLEITDCILSGLDLISSQSLKRLTIKGGYFGEWRLPICAPNLVSLWLEVVDGRTPSLQRMPSLQIASVKIFGNDRDRLDYYDDSNQSILFQSLSQVQNLVLRCDDTKMFIFRSDMGFCSSFNKLKSLLLDEYWCEPTDFSALACLLKLAPVLEKLTLQLYSKGPKHKVDIKLSCKPLEMSAAISQHLRTLEVKCEVYDDRVHNVLTFLSKQLNICQLTAVTFILFHSMVPNYMNAKVWICSISCEP